MHWGLLGSVGLVVEISMFQHDTTNNWIADIRGQNSSRSMTHDWIDIPESDGLARGMSN